ncbi:hypothetical protein KUTeg_006579 [Tegillarca granosa]|uniref:Fibronectin type-III domain-containing protein n=1 Tax=Tegillarca granosa TaxID=220873 RepID=A0ABQ9FAP2_TEGGR|nr:hypothetical protein KUTeg_006579 [Tegillarca granosa]
MSFEVANLEPDTSYQIKVRALSKTGEGPWSNVFVGRTLTEDLSWHKNTIIWANSRRRVYMYDKVTGEKQISFMKDAACLTYDWLGQKLYWSVPNLGVVSMAYDWLGQKLYWSVPNLRVVSMAYDWLRQKLYWSVPNLGVVSIPYDWLEQKLYWSVPNLRVVSIAYDWLGKKLYWSVPNLRVVSMAYDWLGQKLYWSVPNLGVIRRADISGNDVEFVIQGSARRLAIDSINGRLYWVTTNSLESSYLNGDGHMVYFSVPFFSGKQVISLTLNFDLQKVLWYVKGFERQDLYMSDLLREGMSQDQLTIKYIGSFRSISETSGLQYYSHRIFWQNTANSVVVGDIECNYTSVISSRKVATFSVRHHTLQKYPGKVAIRQSVAVYRVTIRQSVAVYRVAIRQSVAVYMVAIRQSVAIYRVAMAFQTVPVDFIQPKQFE